PPERFRDPPRDRARRAAEPRALRVGRHGRRRPRRRRRRPRVIGGGGRPPPTAAPGSRAWCRGCPSTHPPLASELVGAEPRMSIAAPATTGIARVPRAPRQARGRDPLATVCCAVWWLCCWQLSSIPE